MSIRGVGGSTATKTSLKTLILISVIVICALASLVFFSFNVARGMNVLFPNLSNLIKSLSNSNFKSGSAQYIQNGSTTTLADFSIGGSSYGVKTNSTKSFISSSTNYQLGMASVVYGLSLNAGINLRADDSLIRVVLVDKNNKEYLVYEAYPVLNNKGQITVSNICEETCVLNAIVPAYLKLQINDAEITINAVNYLNSPSLVNSQVKSMGVEAYDNQLKTKQIDYKVAKINEEIKSSGMHWLAARTSVSDLNYEQKKKLFSNQDGTPVKEVPNLQGLEYYKGGVFELKDSSPEVKTVASPTMVLPDNWDWRNVNGENWMTSVKNQGDQGTCWAFGATGPMESRINLYYNSSTLDIDLSEQILVNCRNTPGYNSEDSIKLLFSDAGIADEQFMPYTGVVNNGACLINSDYKSRSWKSANFSLENQMNMNIVKESLIKNGPLGRGYLLLKHAMTLTGYGVIKEGTQIFPGYIAMQSNQPIMAGDRLIGKTYWIVKNSWSTAWGENGYGKIIINGNQNTVIAPPFTPPSSTAYKISCTDRDLDKYCNWGISVQPPASSTCPLTCRKAAGKFIKDFDDFNPKLVSFISETNLNSRSKFDINGDMLINSADQQMVVDGSLGKITITQNPYIDLDGDGKVNAVDVQLEINGILGR
ncbi:MAG: C1 family peptidase [Candidatus Buchananbacteria bacterium]